MIGVAWSLLTSRMAGPVAAALAVILAIALGVTTLQKNSAVRRADKLHAEIHAPVTGYIAEAARCKANVTTLEGSLKRQSDAVAELQRQSAGRIAAAERGWRDAQRAAADARNRAERLVGSTIAGDTRCERVEDADRLVLEMLR